jgi:DNA-binding MarR family transcriptional regulator
MSGQDARAEHPVLLACRGLARAMDLFDEAACTALGVGRSDLRALNLLEHGPLTAGTLAQQLHLTRPAVTALVDRLVAAGLVERASVAGDRRATAVALTPATWEAFARVYRPLGDRVRDAVTALAPDGQAAVGAGLEVLGAAFRDARAHLAEAPPEPGR